jgi:hypothetical protein
MTKGGDRRAALHPPRRPARPLEIHESLKTLRDRWEVPTREANGPMDSSRWTRASRDVGRKR